MAERTEMADLSVIPGHRGMGKTPKYDKFFDGSVWRLDVAEDTTARNATNARTAIYDRARKLGIRVSVYVEPGERTILVQKVGER